MKRILWLVILLISIIGIASADVLFAFEQLEFELPLNETLKLKPVLQGIDDELEYSWKTEDDNIAIVNKDGVVTAISKGITKITCTGEDKNGIKYNTACNIKVVQLVEEIKAVEKKVQMMGFKKYNPRELFEIYPEDADNKELSIKTSDYQIASVLSETFGATGFCGSATITAQTTDGSNLTARVTIEVPDFYILSDAFNENKELILSEDKKYIVYIQNNASGIFSIDAKGSSFDCETPSFSEQEKLLSESGLELVTYSSVHCAILTPVKAGNGTLRIRISNKRHEVPVIVKKTAIIDKNNYPPATVKEILDKIGGEEQKVYLSGTIVKITKEMIYFRDEEGYFAIRTNENTQSWVKNGARAALYGKVIECTTYETETGLKFKCPLLELRRWDDT